MLRGGQQAFSHQFRFIIRFELPEDKRQFHRPEKGVHFGDLRFQIVLIPFAQAARHIHFVQPAPFFKFNLL